MNLIEKNYEFSKKLKKCFLNEKKIEKKLKIAKYYATFCFENRTGTFQDLEFEKELGKISAEYAINTYEVKENSNDRTLHVATEVYSSGGHTRVINNWIKFEGKEQDLLIINSKRSQITDWLKNTLIVAKGKIILLQEKDDLEKAKELFNIAKNYKRIILHVHPNDIIPILAFSNSKIRRKIYFYNHADHVFWLGLTINKCVLDLTFDGRIMSLKKRGVKNTKVLSIPLEKNIKEEKVVDRNQIYKLYNLECNSKVIFSMATEYKYNTILKYNFFEFLEELIPFLIENNTYFLIAGPSLSKESWKKIYEKSKKRIIPLGIVSKEKVKELWKIVDIYVDSFPLNSYTCLLEAIANNIISVSLKTPIPDLDCLKDIKIDSMEKFIEEIKKNIINRNNISKENIEFKLEKFHFKNGFLNNLKKIYLENDEKDINNYRIVEERYNDEYEQFFVNQKNERKFFSRNGIYYTLKKLLKKREFSIIVKLFYYWIKRID